MGWRDHLSVPVLCNGDVYMIDSPTGKNRLLKYSISKDTWSDFFLPCDAKTSYMHLDQRHQMAHVLTTYGSKLLLIACADSDSLPTVDTTAFTFKVWEFNESTFKRLPDIIPPQSKGIKLHFEHRSIAAASGGKYLIISGKSHVRNTQCYMQLTFDGVTWEKHEGPCLYNNSTHQLLFYHHSILLVERLSKQDIYLIYETSIQSLVDNDPNPWQLLKSTMPYSSHCFFSNFIAQETHLSLVSYSCKEELKVWHYFVDSESWQEAVCAKAPSHPVRGYCGLEQVHAVRLPDESLMTIFCGEPQTIVYKLKLNCKQLIIKLNSPITWCILPYRLVKECPLWIAHPSPSFYLDFLLRYISTHAPSASVATRELPLSNTHYKL